MLELTADNAVDYLRGAGFLGPQPARVELLSGGVSNAVFRIEAGTDRYVLKQSRAQLRTRADWFSDLERVYREQEVMQALAGLLPPGIVPEVLFSDRGNFAFVMSHAPRAARIWKTSLLAGEVDLAVGELAGRVLGRIHEASAADREMIERFSDRTVFVQLRVDPFYRRIQERHPDLAPAVEELIQQLLSRRDALCHGDFSPKNILTHRAGFTLVDYETAHAGDPTMDLGFFLSHLLLKAVHRHAERQRYFELTRTFWRGYQGEVSFAHSDELQSRGIGHLGICLLARIDGTSPVDYLRGEEQREEVRRLGRALLLSRPGSWEEVLRLAGQRR
jgi:5-methylthioribose kinase